jgi:hypothetical protein
MEKIYCKDCIYYREPVLPGEICSDICAFIDEPKRKELDRRDVVGNRIGAFPYFCREKNVNYDCKDFKRGTSLEKIYSGSWDCFTAKIAVTILIIMFVWVFACWFNQGWRL